MKIPTLSADLIDALRSRFFAKDRSIYLASNCLAYLSNGAYLSNAFISETSLSASATSVTFSNIPQGFRHLMLFNFSRTDAAVEVESTLLRFNGDTGSNYDGEELAAVGAVVVATPRRASTSIVFTTSEGASSRAATFSAGIGFVLNYSTSGVDKKALALCETVGNLSADADLFLLIRSGHWRNTNVITSINIRPETGPNFVAGSRFQLYGIL